MMNLTETHKLTHKRSEVVKKSRRVLCTPERKACREGLAEEA